MEGGDRRVASQEAGTQAEGGEAEIEGGAHHMIEIVGIDHVQLSMPPGGEDEARRFYGEILRLREIAKPPELDGRGGCWFAAPDAAIHLASEPDFRSHAKAHPALLIRDLAAARDALTGAGVRITEDDAHLAVRRCYIHDPFGNRIELVDARDSGFSAG